MVRDGVLDCKQDEVVLNAGVRVSGGSEEAVAAAALKQWTDEGGSLSEFPGEDPGRLSSTAVMSP